MAKEKSFALLEPSAPKESLEPCERRLRQKTPLTHRASVLSKQDGAHQYPT